MKPFFYNSADSDDQLSDDLLQALEETRADLAAGRYVINSDQPPTP